jgi:hypothetical protein
MSWSLLPLREELESLSNDCMLCHEPMSRPVRGTGRRTPFRSHPACWVRYSTWAAREALGRNFPP